VLARLVLLPLLVVAAPLPAQDTKEAADAIVHRLRALQPADLSWGESLQDACRALDALARSPRAYTDLDGPFFRVPAQRIAQAKPGSVDDALVVLALGQCLNGQLAQARDEALQRLLSGPPRRDYAALLALRTYPPPDLKLPAATDADVPEVAVLLAADPASVKAPPLEPADAWTRWARAARLRGVKPESLPPVPEPGPDAGFAELLGALETVNALHGVLKGAPSPQLPEAQRPGLVPPGQDLTAALERAFGFYEAQQRGGTFGLGVPGADDPEPGITAMALTSTLWIAERTGKPRPEWVDAGLDFLVSLQRPDGSIQMHGLDVYTTSVAIEALVAGGREQDRAAIGRARDFLMATQSDEGEGYLSAEDPHYGGVGYGGDERPDLSNTQMAIEAVRLAGASQDDPFFAKARVFLERCQNFGEQQSQRWPRVGGGVIVSGNDGGGTYMPGNAFAGEVQVADGVWEPRSYGSMSYALAKSFVLSGASLDDPRVDAVVRWLARHFSVETNPGYSKPAEGAQGLYYYYLVMARTLALLPEGRFRDEQGQPIAWREALQRKLLDTQRTDGSWINEASPRWWEGAPPLATSYAVLALRAAQR
jgi:squalene-hopene/tetraprenyl-beta-curcumene cyclase